MSTNSLRSMLGAALAIALGSALICGGASADTLIVGKAAPNADPIIALDVGTQAGIFKKHGLDITIVEFNGGGKMVQALTAGALEIGDGAGTEMALVAKGAPMRAICENTGTFPFLSIGVPWDSPLKSVKDLKGKKIGVSGAGSLTEWLVKELARIEGWGADGIAAVGIGNGASNVISAFRGNLVDGDVGATSLFLQMEAEKTGRVLAPVSDFEGNAASGVLFASNTVIDSKPGAIRAFLAGWIETVDYMRAHKAETVKIESKVTGFSEGVMAREYDLTIGMFTKDCRFNPQSLATLKRTFVDLKLLSAPPEMEKLYTEAFLPK